jgi:glycosyltransferase involved in cell wall biosynthesis
VVIPTYNPGGRLAPALASVVAQDFEDWEAIVVDDGSTEDLSWVPGVDGRIRLVQQSNRGVSVARNRGLALTSAPLVAFLDQDDTWHPQKLVQQVEALRTRVDVGLCDTLMTIQDDAGVVIGTGYADHHGTYQGLLAGAAIGLSTVLARRQAVVDAGGFNPALRVNQDWDLFLRVGLSGWSFLRLPHVLATYRVHPLNTSRDYRRALAELDSVLAQHVAAARARRDETTMDAIRLGRRRVRRVLGSQAYDAFRAGLHQRDPSAILDLAHALQLDPRRTAQGMGQAVVARARGRSEGRAHPWAR